MKFQSLLLEYMSFYDTLVGVILQVGGFSITDNFLNNFAKDLMLSHNVVHTRDRNFDFGKSRIVSLYLDYFLITKENRSDVSQFYLLKDLVDY